MHIFKKIKHLTAFWLETPDFPHSFKRQFFFSPVVLILSIGLQDVNEARNSAHLLWPPPTRLWTHPEPSGLSPALIQPNDRALKNYNLLIQVRADFSSCWSYVILVGLLIPPNAHVGSSMGEYTQTTPNPLWHYKGDSQSTFCCMYLYLPDSYI